MRRMLLLVAKDLRRKARAPLGFLILLSFPLLFAGVVALVFGRDGGDVPKVRLLVRNADEGIAGRALVAALGSEQMAEYFDVRSVGDEGRALIEEGEASALLVVPKGFTRDLLDGRPVTLGLVRNPAEGILPEIAEQTASILAQILDGGVRVLRGPLDEMRPYLEGSSRAPTDLDVTTISLAFKHALEGAGTFVFPPAITLEGAFEMPSAAAARDDGRARGGGISAVFVLILPGVAVYALFLIGDAAMRDVLVEMRDGTLRRQLAGPIGVGTVVAAKALYTIALALVALVVLSVATVLVLRRAVSVPGFALLSLAVVVAVAGASAALYGWARTERRGATTASVVYLAMAFVGGSFIPLQSLPASLRPVAPFTPFYWGTTGYLALMDRGAGWVEVLPNVAVLGLMGGVLLALGAFALRRAVSRGVTG